MYVENIPAVGLLGIIHLKSPEVNSMFKKKKKSKFLLSHPLLDDSFMTQEMQNRSVMEWTTCLELLSTFESKKGVTLKS